MPTDEDKLSAKSLRDIVTRESMAVRISQTALTAPVVLASLIVLDITLRGRVDIVQYRYVALMMAASTLVRVALCQWLKPKVKTATSHELRRYEGYLFTSAIISSMVNGLTFSMVASTGDITVRFVITLVACFYAIGTLVNASSHFPSFAVVTILNLGQGILFWMGFGGTNPPQYEIAFPFLAVTLLIIGFGRDNSRRFRSSIEIRTENAELVQQLGLEKRRLEQALESARLASESKSRFLAAASHDLRQPLHAMTMFLGTLTFHVTTDEAKRLLSRIKDTTIVLEDQFDSLLDLSKFDVGAVTPELIDFSIDRVIKLLVEEFRPHAEEKGLNICAQSCAATAFSDPMLVERVLRNLISNAVKYTSVGSVSVIVKNHESGLCVEVSDTGPGIPADQQIRVFEEYVQLSNPARQRRYGVGLGLAIVKRIDSLLDLGLQLHSVMGTGTTFTFMLPRSSANEAVSMQAVVATYIENFTTKARVWVLDDDQIVLEGISEQLGAWGAAVEVFSEPDALLARLRQGNALPNWILTDDMLGSALSGLETAQILSSEFGFGRVCLITGNTEPQRLAQLRSSGFPVIIKPAHPEALMAIINS